MKIEHKKQGSTAVVSMVGSLDTLTAPSTTDYLNTLISGGEHRLVIDFGGVDYTSSAGLRVLLAAVKETRTRGGDLFLAGIRPDVQKVLTMSGFVSIMKIFGSVDEAVKAFG